MKKLCLGNVTSTGWTSWYFRVSKTKGIKIIPRIFILKDEITRLKRWNKKYPCLFPHLYGVTTIKVCGKKFKGIILEHIAGRSGWSITRRQFKSKVLPQLPKTLVRRWGDCYRGNIIFQGKKIRCIDAGRKFIKAQIKPIWSY